jgi:hypothetical protein
MAGEDLLRKLPAGGLLKKTQAKPASLTQRQRVALVRKGNEVFNRGDIALAERIYRTTRYGAGLARIGDWYRKQNRPLEALSAYRAGRCRAQADVLVERMARVLSGWLSEEGGPVTHERRAEQ